jgi:hypothetical protein
VGGKLGRRMQGLVVHGGSLLCWFSAIVYILKISPITDKEIK